MSVRVESDQESSRPSSPAIVPASLVWLSLLVALLATLGSLWLSVGMSLKACPLCFYQRTFAMSILGVLGIGVFTGTRHRNVLNVLALPLAVGGFGVAAFHVYLELTGKLECPPGVMGIGTSPQQSLAILTLLLVLVVFGVVRAGTFGEPKITVSIAAFILGVLFAFGAVVSAPPMPGPPTKAYETPLEICRPPYQP
jgi:disulfide bond formation protein DsbB